MKLRLRWVKSDQLFFMGVDVIPTYTLDRFAGTVEKGKALALVFFRCALMLELYKVERYEDERWFNYDA